MTYRVICALRNRRVPRPAGRQRRPIRDHVIRHVVAIEVIHTYKGTDTMQLLIVGRDVAGVGACV